MSVYLEDRVGKLEKQFNHIEACLANLAVSSVKLEKRMDALEQRVDRIEQRVDRIEQRVDRIEQKVSRIEQKVDRILKILESNQ